MSPETTQYAPEESLETRLSYEEALAEVDKLRDFLPAFRLDDDKLTSKEYDEALAVVEKMKEHPSEIYLTSKEKAVFIAMVMLLLTLLETYVSYNVQNQIDNQRNKNAAIKQKTDNSPFPPTALPAKHHTNPKKTKS